MLNRVQLGVQIRLTIGHNPVPLHHFADRQPGQSADDEHHELLASAARAAQQLPGQQAKDHGRQRGHEAQREIAAAVVDERLGSRKQIQEPLVERGRGVGVLVPMSGDAREVWPITAHAHRCVVEIGRRQRVAVKIDPITDQDANCRGPLNPTRAAPQQKQERVAQSDLGQHVLEGEVGLRATVRS